MRPSKQALLNYWKNQPAQRETFGSEAQAIQQSHEHAFQAGVDWTLSVTEEAERREEGACTRCGSAFRKGVFTLLDPDHPGRRRHAEGSPECNK